MFEIGVNVFQVIRASGLFLFNNNISLGNQSAVLDGFSYWSVLLNKDQSAMLDGIPDCGHVAVQRPEHSALWDFYLRA